MPNPLSLSQALDRSEALARLTQRLRESSERFAVIEPVLPAALRTWVRPGPVDDKGWTLLAANSAVAAKLRQLLPALATALDQKGFQATRIRVRIQST